MSGKLQPDLSVWTGNDNTPIHSQTGSVRSKIDIPDPDVPTKFFGSNLVDSTHNQFVTFDATSARKDVRFVIYFFENDQINYSFFDSETLKKNRFKFVIKKTFDKKKP